MLTINKISEITGIDRRTIKKRLSAIKPISHVGKNTYYSEDVLGLVRCGGRKRPAEREQLECQRLRIRIEQAQFKFDVEKRALLPTNAIEQWVAMIITAARQRFLALPRKVAPHVVGLDTDQVTAVIDEAVKEILDELENEPWPEGMRQPTG